MIVLPDDAHIGHVTLVVRNLDASVAFYRDVIGFRVLTNASARAALSADGERTILELHERRDAVNRPRRCTGLFHFAILVPTRAALGRSLRRLTERRRGLSGASDHLVSEALYLNDPDGLGIEIYRDRARETWTRVDGQIAMATLPLDLADVAHEPGADQPWAGLDPTTVIGHVHLHVSTLASAEAFYCGAIGFDPVIRTYPGALFVAAGGYHHHLGLNTWLGEGAPPPPENAVGLSSFSVRAASQARRRLADESTGVVVSLEPE